MPSLYECLIEEAEKQITAVMPRVAEGLLDRSKQRAPVDSGDTRSTMGSFADGMTATIQVFTDQGAITDAGSRPHTITATRPHGILSDGAGFFVGGSKNNPAKVRHPGSTKHKGWFSEAPWDVWLADELTAAL